MRTKLFAKMSEILTCRVTDLHHAGSTRLERLATARGVGFTSRQVRSRLGNIRCRELQRQLFRADVCTSVPVGASAFPEMERIGAGHRTINGAARNEANVFCAEDRRKG